MSEKSFPDDVHLLQLQRDLWQAPDSRAVVMVGAGFSSNAQRLPQASRDMPLWSDLVFSMYQQLHPTFDEKDLRQSFKGENLLTVASEFEASFGRGKLETEIKLQILDSHYAPSELHRSLMQLPWKDVFTTNYDTLLENTAVDGIAYQTVKNSRDLTSAIGRRIVKLHGSVDIGENYIITEEDFRRYPDDNAPFVNTVRQSLIENTFVLLGFSGEDPNFLSWIGWIRDQLGSKHCSIYLVGASNLLSLIHI